LIVFSETIEHLYTSPQIVLAFLAKLLRPGPGAGILIQTPNAASFWKRVRLLLGHNPYELIRTDRQNPGHFREYTMRELEDYAMQAGFRVWFREHCSYWAGSGPANAILNCYPPFREGLSLVLVRE